MKIKLMILKNHIRNNSKNYIKNIKMVAVLYFDNI